MLAESGLECNWHLDLMLCGGNPPLNFNMGYTASFRGDIQVFITTRLDSPQVAQKKKHALQLSFVQYAHPRLLRETGILALED